MALGVRLGMWGLTPHKALERWIREHLCNGLDEAAVQQMVQRGKHPEPPALFFERASRAPPAIPCTYLKLLQDKALPPAVQDAMASRVGARVVELDTGHTAMLSVPGELARVLNETAEGVVVR